MSDAFISYSRVDTGFMMPLRDGLVRRGKDVWVDTADIRATAEWVNEIYRGIEASEAFLFLVSPESLQSDACQRELAHAISLGKRLIPVVRRETDPASAPEELRRVQWLAFPDSDSDDAKADKVASVLDTDLAWSQFHTWLLTRALRWERLGKQPHDLLRGRDLRESADRLQQTVQPPCGPFVTDLQREYIAAGKRAARRRRQLGGVLTGGALVAAALAAAITILSLTSSAEHARQSRSRALAAAATDNIPTNPSVALATALAAVRQAATPEAETALRRSLAASALYASIGPSPTTSSPEIGYAAWGPTDARLLTALSDDRVAIWDLDSGRARTLAGTGISQVSGLAVSPNGNYAAAATVRAGGYLWDTTSGRLLASGGTDGEATDVQFSSDSQRYLVFGHDFVDVYATPTGRQLAQVAYSSTGDASVTDATFRPGRPSQIATSDPPNGNPDPIRGVIIWNTDHPSRRLVISRDSDGWAVFSPDGLYLLAGVGGRPSLYNANTGKLIVRLAHAPTGVLLTTGATETPVTFAADGRRVAVVGQGYTNLYAVPSGHLLDRFRSGPISPDTVSGGSPPVSGLFDSSRNQVLSGGSLWDVRSHSVVAKFVTPSGLGSAQFSPDGRFVLSVDGGVAHIWDDGALPIVADYRASEPSWTLALSHDGLQVAAVTAPGRVAIWRRSSSRAVTIASSVRAPWLAFTPSDQTLIVAAPTDLRTFDTTTGKPVARIAYFGTHSNSVSRDGRRAIAFGAYGRLEVVDALDGRRVLNIPGNREASSSGAAVSPDSRLVAVSWNKTIEILDASNGERIRTIRVASDGSSLLFDPTDTYLFAQEVDGRAPATVVDLHTGSLIRLHGSGLGLMAAFSGNGRRLLTSGVGGTTIWDTANGAEVLSLTASAGLGVRMNRDGSTFLSGVSGGVSVVSASDGQTYATFPAGPDVAEDPWALSDDGRYVATASAIGEVTVRACPVCGDNAQVIAAAAQHLPRLWYTTGR